MHYRFYTADVFTGQLFGGNPLAVFPQAKDLDTDLMQRIAREFNLSETVFVFLPENPAYTRRLRIFTPAAELPFAGHPTIGTAYILASIGAIPLAGERTTIVFEEGVGPVPVTLFAHHGQPLTAQLTAARLPEFGPPPPAPAALAAVLALDEAEILTGHYHSQAVSCGVPFLIVPLRDRVALQRARLQRDRWEQVLASYWAPHLYLIAFDPTQEGAPIRARMFAPALGVDEDPATGAAAATLGGYLSVREPAPSGSWHWRIEQGVDMGRPSLLEIEADKRDGTIQAVRVGGAAVLVSEGVFHLPEAP